MKALLWLCPFLVLAAQHQDKQEKSGARIVDLSLLVASEYPCTWPAGFPLFQINHYQRPGPRGAYNSDLLTIDGNTGTQLDFPPHSVPYRANGVSLEPTRHASRRNRRACTAPVRAFSRRPAMTHGLGLGSRSSR